MASRIFKYPLEVGWRQVVPMPKEARIIHCAAQHGRICLWAIVDDSVAMEDRVFRIYGTGNVFDVDLPLAYTGSVQLDGGALVLHVFEEGARNG